MIPLGAMIAIHIPAVQTSILQMVTGALSKNYDGRVNVGRMYFHPFQSLVLRDVGIFEASGDTLIWLDKVAINLNEGVTLAGETLEVNRLTLENGVMHIRHIDTTETNLSYFISCLSAPKEEEEEEEESSFSLPFSHYRLDRLLLNSLSFSYENEFQEEFQGYFIDSLTLRADDLNYSTDNSTTGRSNHFPFITKITSENQADNLACRSILGRQLSSQHSVSSNAGRNHYNTTV